MPTGLALSCRSCAAPLTDGLMAPCPSCGAVTPPDPALQVRLERAAGRVRRVAARVLAHARGEEESVQTLRIRPLILVCSFAGLMLWIALPLAWVALIGALTNGQGAGAYCGACVMLPLLVLGWTPTFGVVFVIGKWTRRRANRHATQVAREIDLTVAAQCPHCGAHIQQLAVGYGGKEGCAWCGSELVAPESSMSALQAAEQTLLESRSGQARDAWDKILGRTREISKRPEAAGLTFAAAMWTGTVGGFSAWCAEDQTPHGILRQLEVDAPLELTGTTWLLPEENKAHRQLAAALGLPDAEGDPTPHGHHVVMGADVERVVGAAQSLIQALGPREALLLEPAGLSLHRLSPSARTHMSELPKPWLRDRVPLLVAVAEALRLSPN